MWKKRTLGTVIKKPSLSVVQHTAVISKLPPPLPPPVAVLSPGYNCMLRLEWGGRLFRSEKNLGPTWIKKREKITCLGISEIQTRKVLKLVNFGLVETTRE